jgi:hypothetical protein
MTILVFLTMKVGYYLLITNPKVKNEDSNPFYYGKWRKICSICFLFWSFAFLIILMSWLTLLDSVALIAYVVVIIWGFKWDDGRLADWALREIP